MSSARPVSFQFTYEQYDDLLKRAENAVKPFYDRYGDFLNWAGNAVYRRFQKEGGLFETGQLWLNRKVINNWIFNGVTLAVVVTVFFMFLAGSSFFLIKSGLLCLPCYFIRSACRYQENFIGVSVAGAIGFLKENKAFALSFSVTFKQDTRFEIELFKPLLTS